MDEAGSIGRQCLPIVRAEIWSSFEELDESDLHSGNYHEERETSAQADCLRETVDSVWTSLKILCNTEISKLDLSYFNSKEQQDALKEAIQTRDLNKEFLTRSVRAHWKFYLQEKNQKARQGLRNSKKQRSRQGLPKAKKQQSRQETSSTPTPQDIRKITIPGSSEDILEDLQPQTCTFPVLEDLIDKLLDKLNSDGFFVHDLKSYRNELQKFESLETLKERIMKSIPLEVKGLQGHEVTLELQVTRENLEKVFTAQDPISEWPKVGGYLAYVTSCNDPRYWRPYIGQSSFLARRIQQHITETIHRSKTSLFYWVASKPGRKLNFINLWEVSDDEDYYGNDQIVTLLSNLLEMLFCLCFRSLPLELLQTFLGETVGSSSFYGLNVVSPLLQDIDLTPIEKTNFRSMLKNCPSAETKEFYIHRTEQLRDTCPTFWKFSPTYDEIRNAFLKAIPEGIPTPSLNHDRMKFSSELSQLLQKIREDAVLYLESRQVPKHLWAPPVGSMKAPVGFILDFDIKSTQPTQLCSDLPPSFPTVLASIGFNETNCLLWPFNFQTPHVPRKITVAHQDHFTLQGMNRQIISSSNIQMIILCGPNAENAAVLDSFEKIKLKIRDMSFDVFLETGDESYKSIQRVYLRLPGPLSKIHSSHWQMRTRIALAIKTAACLTQTQSIEPYYFSSRTVISEIVSVRLNEEKGKPQMTVDTITENIRAWLHLRGFDSDDVTRLGKMTGSISRGILLAVLTAPRRPRNTVSRGRTFQTSNRPLFCHKFEREHLQIARELHSKKLQQREVELKTLGVITDHSSDSQGSLEMEEVSEDFQAVSLDPFAFEECAGSSTNSCETKTSELSLEVPEFLKVKKKKKSQTARSAKAVTDSTCVWCKELSSTERYTWNSILGGFICNSCHVSLCEERRGYLPICKFMVLDLAIECGYCGLSRSSRKWSFGRVRCVPFCSTQCLKSIDRGYSDEKREEIRRGTEANLGPESKTWLEQMDDKFYMSKELRTYFREAFGIDTSMEGIQKNGVPNALAGLDHIRAKQNLGPSRE